jgi:multimeric flavodoxin WrbA
MKLLAVAGSHRGYGNSYPLAEEVLKSIKDESKYEIIQLAEKKIQFCNFCGECETGNCILTDDFSQILDGMQEADGILFSFPKYFSLPSKFLCFLERLVTIHYFRKIGKKPDLNFILPFKGKPFCYI